jgi:hypothetical protein
MASLRSAIVLVTLTAAAWTGTVEIEEPETSLFGSAALDAAICLMESDELKFQASVRNGAPLVEGLNTFFRESFLGKDGKKLKDEVLWKLENGTDRERRKAMILAGHCEGLELQDIERLRSSLDRTAAAWAFYHPLSRSEELRLESDPSMYKRGGGDWTSALVQCKQAITQQLISSPEELVGKKQDYLEGYQDVYLPNLARLEMFPSDEQCYWVDTDGDGRDELLMRFAIPDGWHEVVVSLELVQGWDGQWSVKELYKFPSHFRRGYLAGGDFLIADLDSDGLPEVCASSTSLGRGASDFLSIRGANGSYFFSGLSVDLLASPSGGAPLVRESSMSNTSGYGTAGSWLTTFGREITLTEFTSGGGVSECVVIVQRGE